MAKRKVKMSAIVSCGFLILTLTTSESYFELGNEINISFLLLFFFFQKQLQDKVNLKI